MALAVLVAGEVAGARSTHWARAIRPGTCRRRCPPVGVAATAATAAVAMEVVAMVAVAVGAAVAVEAVAKAL